MRRHRLLLGAGAVTLLGVAGFFVFLSAYYAYACVLASPGTIFVACESVCQQRMWKRCSENLKRHSHYLRYSSPEAGRAKV